MWVLTSCYKKALLRVPSSALANALQLRSSVYISVWGCVHERINLSFDNSYCPLSPLLVTFLFFFLHQDAEKSLLMFYVWCQSFHSVVCVTTKYNAIRYMPEGYVYISWYICMLAWCQFLFSCVLCFSVCDSDRQLAINMTCNFIFRKRMKTMCWCAFE